VHKQKKWAIGLIAENIFLKRKVTMRKVSIFAALVCILILPSCDKGANSPRGFSLPQGDPVIGKQVFVKHNCLSCHSVAGLSDDNVEREWSPPIVLGSNSSIVMTYAQLVTGIINPSHRLSRGESWSNSDENGDSIMRNYNDVLTVSELVDVVTYLQPHYKVAPWPYTSNSIYKIPNGALPEKP
jgi:mono/diheme cytochrome c family protein